MAKQTSRNVWSIEVQSEPAIIRSYRQNLLVFADDLSSQVIRLRNSYQGNAEKKLALRENSKYLSGLLGGSLKTLIDSEDEIHLVLDFFAREAEESNNSQQRISFLKRPLSKDTIGDRILRIVDDIRNIYALIIHQYNILEKSKNSIPNVPDQQPAPIKVNITDNHLHLTSSQTRIGTLSAGSLENLREAIHNLLSRTIDQIASNSNIDPRLAPNLRGLNSYLEYRMDTMPIEALGLNYQFARRSFEATRDTIPDLVIEQIDQILSTVNVILNQYDEWRLYVSAETAFSLPPSSLEAVLKVGRQVEEFLEDNDTLVEPKLINRLKEITDAYSQGLVNLESAAVPLIESLGNIFSELSRFVISHTPEAAGSVGTPGAVILFLGFAIKSIETFTPTLSGFPPLSYLIDVQKFAHKQFSLIKDSLPGAL